MRSSESVDGIGHKLSFAYDTDTLTDRQTIDIDNSTQVS